MWAETAGSPGRACGVGALAACAACAVLSGCTALHSLTAGTVCLALALLWWLAALACFHLAPTDSSFNPPHHPHNPPLTCRRAMKMTMMPQAQSANRKAMNWSAAGNA